MERLETKEAIKQLASRKDITTEQFQKIISALRGPDSVEGKDNNCDKLKYYTTARIRAIVVPGYFGDITKHALTPMELEIRDTMLKYAPHHFQSHYKEAVKAIKQVFNYDLKTEKEVTDDKYSGSGYNSKMDCGTGSGIGTVCGEVSCAVCDTEPGQKIQQILDGDLLGTKTVQLLERLELCNEQVEANGK